MITKKYDYTALSRQNINGSRHYVTPTGEKLVSVTTILDRTKSEHEKQILIDWKNKVGEDEAHRIATTAAARGTKMHTFLEHYVLADRLLDANTGADEIQSRRMAQVIVDNAFQNIDEIWGSEISLYHTGLYAGSTDATGMWKGKPAIIDYKQSNKPKRREWLSNYFAQVASYAAAHNNMYNTKIQTGVILLCTQEFEYQEFVIEGDEFEYWTNHWWDRVAQYYGVQ